MGQAPYGASPLVNDGVRVRVALECGCLPDVLLDAVG